MKKRISKIGPVLFAILLFLLILLAVWRIVPVLFVSSPIETVEEFYTFEQEGDFGSAWDLFHSKMKERFSKTAYVTERSHIYMSHYGVATFSFEIVDREKLKTWKMDNSSKEFEDVYRVQVEQTFKSKFGSFTVQQDVYVVEENGEWLIVWQYE
jgi:hypothetical protein